MWLTVVAVGSMSLLGSADSGNLRASARQLQAVALDALSEIPVTQCAENTFFIDWGSSGMKILPVHREGGEPAAPGLSVESLGEVKLEGVGPDVSEQALRSILDELSGKLTQGHVGGAAIATAGFRLSPAVSEATWSHARAWNAEHRLFVSCDLQVDAGCRTVTGIGEAELETLGMMQQSQRDGVDLGPRFGMVSCGGASVQLAIWGPDAAVAQSCVQQLQSGGGVFEGRKDYNSTLGAAFFSWLSNHVDRVPVGTHWDHEAGGVNEMRAVYDGWLADSGPPGATNPCISPNTSAIFSTSDVCDFYAGSGTQCLVDSWGGYMTHLPGQTLPERAQCTQSVDAFLSSDAMLNAWLSSAACRQLATETPEWGLLSSFSREAQLGSDVSSPTAWSAVLAENTATVSANAFETAADIEARQVGGALTSTLLVGFLRHLGLDPSSTVRASEADVSLVAMESHSLVPGWVSGCEAALPGGCEVPFNTVLSVHAAGGIQRAPTGPFESLTVVEAACAPGFEGSQPEWRLQCIPDGSWRDLNASAPGMVAGSIPDCAPVHCEAPVGSGGSGTWRGPGTFGSSFVLDCPEGYVTAGGPADLVCNSSNPFTQPIATCVPVASDSMSTTTIGIAVGIVGISVLLAGVAYAVCHRDPVASDSDRSVLLSDSADE